jgi:malic enzyme
MNIIDVLRDKRKLAVALVFLVGGGSLSSAVAGDLMSTICRNEVVSVGDRKGVVLMKCGPPLSKSQDSVSTHTSQSTLKKKSGKKQTDPDKTVTTKTKTVKERAESWTYKIDGSYRTFIFKEGKLANIETGGLAN